MANYEPKRTDLTGQRFGRLLVVKYAFTKKKHVYWRCLCLCGTATTVSRSNLKNGSIVSCGCKQREDRIKLGKANATHGCSRKGRRTPEYNSWYSMRQRCRDKNHTFYRLYGGRGIKICKRWDRFENFLADMGKRPEGRTLDRINPNGNYTPSNCRWATRLEQRHNRTKH